MNMIQAPGPGPGTQSVSHGCCGSGGSSAAGGNSGSGVASYIPSFLKTRRGMIVAAVVVVGGGMALGWPTLVVLGVAPIILGFLPCAAMCAMGMCMMGGKKTQSPAVQETTSNAIGAENSPVALAAPQNGGYGPVIDMEPVLQPNTRAMAS